MADKNLRNQQNFGQTLKGLSLLLLGLIEILKTMVNRRWTEKNDEDVPSTLIVTGVDGGDLPTGHKTVGDGRVNDEAWD